MKVKSIKTYTHQGRLVSPGDVFDSDIGEELIRNGLAVAADAREQEKTESKPAKRKSEKE